MTEPPFDVAAAQRWFAIEANNGAWDLVEKQIRTPQEVERMLHLAHASVWHWQAVGQPLNQLRGLTLLTTAYVAANLPEAAVRFGEQGLKLLDDVSDATPFDRACIQGAMAAAYRHVGHIYAARRCERDAAAIELSDADELGIFEKLYPQPATP